jgi:hypothetical protein
MSDMTHGLHIGRFTWLAYWHMHMVGTRLAHWWMHMVGTLVDAHVGMLIEAYTFHG